MSTSSKNVRIPPIPQPKETPSTDAAAREVRNITGSRTTTTATTSAAKRTAFRRSTVQLPKAPKNERVQAGTPAAGISNTSIKKGIIKKTRKNSKNNRPNSMNKATIRLSKLTATSFDTMMPSNPDKRTSGKSVPLAYKKIMIR